MMRLWYSVILILLFPEAIFSRKKCKSPAVPRPVHTFENGPHLCFTASRSSSLEVSTTRYKEGKHSMKWDWMSGDFITYEFTPKPIKGKELRKGGIKLWLYNTQKISGIGKELTIEFLETASSPQTVVSRFKINLNFEGWRGIWVAHSDFKVVTSLRRREINRMKIIAPNTSPPSDLFFDLIRFVEKLSGQTRDEIVPPNSAQAAVDIRDFWQQTYRWSQNVPFPDIDDKSDLAKEDTDLQLIEKRLENWFCDESESSATILAESSATLPKEKKRRFKSLPVDRSHVNFVALEVKKTGDVITGTPLYARDSEFDDKKFGFVMSNVLLPMALDYHIRSRNIDVEQLADTELSNLNGGPARRDKAVQKIAGADQTMKTAFNRALDASLRSSSSDYTIEDVKHAIGQLNDKRKERLLLLLEYIKDQGFTSGSGLGSLNHEMNKAGAGFMTAAFVLRKLLRSERKLSDYVDTMKWYTDFGEVYQDTFEYKGTTADRMRTISLWRLFAVLMMPSSTTLKKRLKIRDMKALVSWYNNALTPNEAFAGLLKPDFVAFHHFTFYASAYTPQALHVAALIQYLLSGTSFDLATQSMNNIEKGLETLRIVSVKYSTPNSVSGRFPGFTRAILSKILPAYAYAGANAPSLVNGKLGAISVRSNDIIRMFVRLYDKSDSVIDNYLRDGSISKGIYYTNSIGSIDIMEKISRLAQQNALSAEPSPTGFWSKNYAALAVYRKEDWAVSVKGFNRFVWDFEGPVLEKENLFGIYQSHGAILIANSEASLQTHDVDNGWDWTRHPGVTTIKLDLDYLKSDAHRYFQPGRLAGSVKLVGSGGNPVAVGAWGMDFSQPQYEFPDGSFQSDINFSFKKSVFFFDSYVICLGSNIRAANSCPYITQTALFQDKRQRVGASFIEINSGRHTLDDDLTKEPSDFNGVNVDATLVDVNGNGYYIPNAARQGLNVQISLQTSKDSSGKKTSARYATAWLDHGVDPIGKEYEYTIAVAGANSILQLASSQRSGSSLTYQVLQKDDNAHIVQMNGQSVKRYGYVIFANSVKVSSGPVRRIKGAHSIIMAETWEGSKDLYIAVSSPDLNFNRSPSGMNRPLNKSSDLTSDEIFFLKSAPVKVEVHLKNKLQVNTGVVTVNGDVIEQGDRNTYVEVVQRRRRKVVKFKNLVKGFTTEVHLTAS